MTNISIRNIIFVAVEIISHSYMSILIYIVVKLKKSHGSKQTICCLVQKTPLKGNLGRFEYIKVVVEDLRIRGYADYLPAYNLDDLRRFALQDDRPSLVRY